MGSIDTSVPINGELPILPTASQVKEQPCPASTVRSSSGAYRVNEAPIHTGRKIRVICIGSGASGLLLAYKIRHNFEESDVDLQIYEKNQDLGGTWLENRYPGCACDCPAHTYTWSFEPKTDWARTYATAPEIHQYFTDFAKKNNLTKYIKFEHQVSGAKWNATDGTWDVEITDTSSQAVTKDRCDILINAAGILNAWRWPAIPGLHTFKGPLLHSASWDPSLNLTGRKVGLIGNGSSGIQILPTILPEAKSVTSFIREATWISPFQQPGFEPKDFTTEEKTSFKKDPSMHLTYRRNIERFGNQVFPLFLENSETQKAAFSGFKSAMVNSITEDSLKTKLVPEWGIGCRRLTPGTGYMESLMSSKSTVVYGEIIKVGQNGLVTEDGKEHDVDVVICATGFDTTFKPRFPLVGSDGIPLSDTWSKEPLGYLGVAAANCPNYFMFLGPNCPIGNGPVLIGIETQADYFMKFIKKFREENIKSFVPQEAAVREFKEHKDEWMKRSVWNQDCRSWYKSPTGIITALWTGSCVHYVETMESPRFEDFNWQSRSANRWAYLGNGFSQRETVGADLGWYIRNRDDSVPLGKKERFMFTQ